MKIKIIHNNNNKPVKCKWEYKQNTYLHHHIHNNNNTDFYVNLIVPTHSELSSFASLSSSLSMGNQHDIEVLIDRRGYNKKWADFNGIYWTIPPDHPGQNRKNCLNLTLRLSEGGIHRFYDDYKTVRRMFYLVHVRHGGLIHPSGYYFL